MASSRTKWSAKPINTISQASESKSGKKYVLSDRTKWSSQNVTNRTDEYVRSQMDNILKELNEDRGGLWTSSPKKTKTYAVKRARYTKGRSQNQMEELRNIASELRTYNNERSRVGTMASEPKFAMRKYENLSIQDRTIVDRLIGNF